jgi:hypothetical protein
MRLPGFTANAAVRSASHTYRALVNRNFSLPMSVVPQQEFPNAMSSFSQINCLTREQICHKVGGYWVTCPVPPCYHCCAIP